MDWFERITGFREEGYDATRRRLRVIDGCLVSDANGVAHRIGRFETPTLAQLRASVSGLPQAGPTTVCSLVGDARALHREPAFAGATFQVASQFNALEMVSPHVSPEHGVTRYLHDRTQGPACAIAAGAATIWRNYLMPLDGGVGQTATRQLDTLAGFGHALARSLGRPVESLWQMRNGYLIASTPGLRAIGSYLRAASEEELDALRGEIAVAWHRGVDVTDAPHGDRPAVSQVFCSALPIAYQSIPVAAWEPFARLVLEAAYEATLLAAWIEREAGGSGTVLLTRLGGGAFGNPDGWIDDAIMRALQRVATAALDVQLVSYGAEHPSFVHLATEFLASGSDS